MTLKHGVVWLAAIMATELFMIGLIWAGLSWNAHQTMERSLTLLGGPANLEEYVLQRIEPGMSRRDVINIAEAIGQYRVKPFYLFDEYCETLQFFEGPFGTRLGLPWSLCYDDDYKLLSITSAAKQ